VVAEAAAKKPAHGPPVEEVEIVLAGQRRELAAAPLSEARVGIRGEVATTRSIGIRPCGGAIVPGC